MPEWVKVNGFDNYSISNEGNVRNDKSGRILKSRVSTCGYACLILSQNGKHYLKYIHRLVGEAFIDNPENLPQIDHIDGDKLHNAVENLRWVTVSENRRAFGNEARARNRMRKVIGINEHGEKVVFDSRKSVAEHFKCHPAKVKYGHRYTRSEKKGWIFYKVEDIV